MSHFDRGRLHLELVDTQRQAEQSPNVEQYLVEWTAPDLAPSRTRSTFPTAPVRRLGGSEDPARSDMMVGMAPETGKRDHVRERLRHPWPLVTCWTDEDG